MADYNIPKGDDRPGSADTAYTMMTDFDEEREEEEEDDEKDEEPVEIERTDFKARRAELEGMSFAKELQPLALSLGLNIFGFKKEDVVKAIVKYEQRQESRLVELAGMDAKAARLLQKEMEEKSAAQKFNLGKSKLTGYSMDVQRRIEQRPVPSPHDVGVRRLPCAPPHASPRLSRS